MKFPFDSSRNPHSGVNNGAFTVMELMTALAVFSLVVAATVAIQLFAMRVYTLAGTKISAATGARKVLGAIRDSIRSSKLTYVGTYNPSDGSGFVQAPDGSPQKGNALALSFSDGGNYVIFYQDSSSPTNLLCSVSNGVVTVLAKYVTNYYCFRAEDYQGNTLSNYQSLPVIDITLQFYQWEYPLAHIGNGSAANYYNWYRLETKVTRREKD